MIMHFANCPGWNPYWYAASCTVAVLLWAVTHRDRDYAGPLYAILAIFVLFGWVFPQSLLILNRWHPLKYDELLFRISYSMGLVPRSYPSWLGSLSAKTYLALPWVMTFFAVLHCAPWGQLRRMASAFVLAYFIAGPLCMIVPACGPVFSQQLYRGSLQPFALAANPNAIPSMHFGSALLLLIFAGPRAWVRGFASAFLALTAAGTLLTGQHYAIDWLPSIPYMFAVTHFVYRRYARSAVCMGATLAWLLSLRMAGPFLASRPEIVWLLAGSTVVGGVTGLLAHYRRALDPACIHPLTGGRKPEYGRFRGTAPAAADGA